MEHIVLSHINKHLSTNQILCSHQHGFRSRLPCETQLVSAIYEWATVLNIRGQFDIIQLDFREGFDKVSHPILLQKLSYYGIHGSTLSWLSIQPLPVFFCQWCTLISLYGYFGCSSELGPGTHSFSNLHQRHCCQHRV